MPENLSYNNLLGEARDNICRNWEKNLSTSPRDCSLVGGGHVLSDLAEEAQLELMSHKQRLVVALAELLAVRADRLHPLVVVGLGQLVEGALQPAGAAAVAGACYSGRHGGRS